MAETKTIEAIVAEKGKKEGEGGKDAGGHRRKSEVEGRYRRGRYVVCPHVGFFVISSKKREPINGTHAGTRWQYYF